MDLKYIKTFKTIIDRGGFLKASYKLNCTQSTVTFHIQQLERELEIKLFEKIGRKMVLTQEAKAIIPYFDTILQSLEQAKNYHKDDNRMEGILRVAMPETLLIYKMQDLLKEFKQIAPNVELSLKGINCYEVRQLIINGNIDLGIHYDVGGYNNSIVTQKLNEFDLTLISSVDLKKQYFDFTKENQNKPCSVISNDPNALYKKIFTQYLENKNIIMNNILELNSIEATKKSVISNLGVAYIPKFVVEEEILTGELLELEHCIKEKKINTIYSYHKNKHLTKPMKLFIDLLHKKI